MNHLSSKVKTIKFYSFRNLCTSPTAPNTSTDSEKDLPSIARLFPALAKLEIGKTRSWCTCGLSTEQPFCDGKHKQAKGLRSLKFTPTKSLALLCMCKQTKNPPYCDMSHLRVAKAELWNKKRLPTCMSEERELEVWRSIDENELLKRGNEKEKPQQTKE